MTEVESSTRGEGQKKIRGQGHRRKCSPIKKGFEKIFSSNLTKKGLQKNLLGKKRLQKFFFRRFPLEKNKQRSSQIFCEVSGAFQ